MATTESALYIVAMPIGNPDDLSPRARHILKHVTYIFAEDTGNTKHLLRQLDLLHQQQVLSASEHQEEHRLSLLKEILQRGESVALVSDAGTPCICDPGSKLVSFAHEQGFRVIPIPGASALTTFLSAIGAPPQPVHFIGFLPKRSQAILEKVQTHQPCLLVFLDSPMRILDNIRLLKEHLPPHTPLYVGRELTKTHEQIWVGTLEKLASALGQEICLKGEFIVGISLEPTLAPSWQPAALSLLPLLGIKQTSQWIAAHLGIPKNQVYDFLTNH